MELWRRGTAFDPFGYTAERCEERRLIREYEGRLEEVLGGLNERNQDLAVRIASLPDQVRGYGHVKQRALVEARKSAEALLKSLHETKEAGHAEPQMSAA